MKITGHTLKIIALITMLIDHAAAVVIASCFGVMDPAQYELWYGVYKVCRWIGRMAFPIYCLLLVEGFTHTRSKARYAGRLFLFALLSEIPFDLAFRGSIFNPYYNNVFFTLLIGFLLIWLLEKIDGTTMMGALLRIAGVLGSLYLTERVLYTDYGAGGVMAILVLYLLKSQKELGFFAAVCVLALTAGRIELFALFMLVPVALYNGERGKQMKYLFYIFYPAHLLVLAGISFLLMREL